MSVAETDALRTTRGSTYIDLIEKPVTTGRVRVDGKHLQVAGQPFRVRGVTYGTFVPRMDGEPFPEPTQIKKDLLDIASAGFNVVRTYTLPPPELFESAEELGLRLLVGLHFEDWRSERSTGRRAAQRTRAAGFRAIDDALEVCRGRPEVLAIAVGNEVPADIIRMHGITSVEETLSQMVERVHADDPEMLVTYCNFPTTEFLQVEGQDLITFNVFLEHPDKLRRYLRHLQIRAGDRPLVITELGLPAAVHGDEAQATSIGWQLRIVDEVGCAGAAIFSWTDEWGVAGHSVEGWGFGLTTETRSPRRALDVASTWARSTIRDLRREWPRVTVVVCAYNEVLHLGWCLRSLVETDYPNLEVIVCDDGSTDGTLEVARKFPFKILELEHGGLSAARNAGIAHADGSIVAFLDADAACHPEWPYHLALSLEDANVAATGGPNLPFEDAGFAERCVAASPGGPVEVLVSDDRAEHVPGCNSAFLKRKLEAVGGFDPVYTSAGDDVDVCWKLLDRDDQIGFSAAAQVRHRRRASISAYLKQQKGYGRAERLLLQRHRHRFNRLGQARWSGFIYGGARMLPTLLRPVIYHGYMGTAPFQQITHRRSEIASSWLGATAPSIAVAGLVGALLAAVDLRWLVLPIATCLVLGIYAVAVAMAISPSKDERRPYTFRATVGFLHVAQPLVRAYGRIVARWHLRRPRERKLTATGSPRWTGQRDEWLQLLIRSLAQRRCLVRPAQPDEQHDLQVWMGPFVTCKINAAVAWGWVPLSSTRYRLSLRGIVLVVVAGLLTLIDVVAGSLLLGCIALASIAELMALRAAVRDSLEDTTKGSSS